MDRDRFKCFAIASLLILLPARASAQAPPDFHLVGLAGGRAPWETVAKIEINSAGDGTYSTSSGDDRAIPVFTLIRSFHLSPADLGVIWTSVSNNGYMALAPVYDGHVEDGTFCTLQILGNAQTNKVTTSNIAVPSFDLLVEDINSVTPDSLDLVYNEIAPTNALIRIPPNFFAGKGTTVTRDDCKITITINIDLTGDLATAAIAAAIKASIENKWNGPNFKFGNWCPVKFVANVNVGSTKAGHHQIEIKGPRQRSYVNNPLPAVNGAGGSGAFRSTAGNDNGAAHEAGHLMGLDDQYTDDPQTGQSKPKTGHEHDLMASLTKGADPALPQATDVNSIINAAGVTCPLACCTFDPVPLPNNLCSVGSTCHEQLIATNRNPTSPLRISPNSNDSHFTISPPNAIINPLGTQPFDIAFTPTAPGQVDAILRFIMLVGTSSEIDSLHATGIAPPCTHAVSSSGTLGGTISPSGNVVVQCGTNQTFQITPAGSCNTILGVAVDGVPVGPVSSYTFTNVLGNHTIQAGFGVLGPFTLHATSGANGEISPSGDVGVNCGGSQLFDITPDTGFQVASVTVDGSPVPPAPSYSFNDVHANHAIDAQFSGISGRDPGTVREIALGPAIPNPATSAAQINFALPTEMPVLISVYDARGRQVARLAEGRYGAGWHAVQWRAHGGTGVPGVYFVRMDAAGRRFERRLVIVH